MKTKKTRRALSLILVLVLLCGMLAVPAGAATNANLAAAQELYQLGLFKGKGVLSNGAPDYDLDSYATRQEAAVMLVRLLGAEQEAKSAHYYHPFTDVNDWADDHLGYAYRNKIVNGTTATTFSSGNRVSARDYLTMLLRAMGYSEVDWNNPYPTAQSIGLAWSGVNDFRRGDMAYISQSALSCKTKGSNLTLRQQLEAKGAISVPSETPAPAPAPGVITPGPVAGTAPSSYTVTSGADALSKLVAAMNCRAEHIVLRGPIGLMQECYQAVSQAQQLCSDAIGYYVSTSYGSQSMSITVSPYYTDAVEIMAYLEGKRSSLSQANAMTLEKARLVHDAVAKAGMSEYERVKALHDYLVNNTTYGGSSDRMFTAGGALVDGVAVCDGYAMAFDLLCYLSGIDCIRVTGSGNGGSHAWNKVQVDGSWYNVDVTWDDPVSYTPMLTYEYFLISDAAISKDHVADYNPYWPAAPASWSW